jgi:predicted nucleotidyltransferase
MPRVESSLSLDDLRSRLAPLFRRSDVHLVVLFGSLAAGTANAKSDVDLGILADGSFEELLLEVVRLLGIENVDLVDLRRASPLLAMAVATKGRVLHEGRPGAFASFASLALRRYNDTAKLRRLERLSVRRFLEERGL